MEKISNHILQGPNGRLIVLDAFYPDSEETRPLVIFCHGFKGFKDWGHFNQVAEMFADSGAIFVKFNFSMNGTTPEFPSDFVNLDAFGKNNFTTELNDLGAVIDWATTVSTFSEKVDQKRICLLGHSRGGGIALLQAATDARISRLITWAAVGDFESWLRKFGLEQWKQTGVHIIPNARTNQEMPLYYQFWEDLQANQMRCNIPEKARQMDKPWLIVHGTEDEAVPFSVAEELNRKAKQSRLLSIPNTGHTFGVGHPFAGTEMPETAQKVIQESIAFVIEL